MRGDGASAGASTGACQLQVCLAKFCVLPAAPSPWSPCFPEFLATDALTEPQESALPLLPKHPACRAKYDELRAKERELNAFVDAFPQRRAAKQAELTAKQEAIVALLHHLTDLQAGNVSTTAAAAAGDGTAPPGGTASASVMQSRMSLSSAAAAAMAGGGGSGSSNDLAAKRAELQKLEELEGKITADLQSLKGQLSGLREEVDTYSDVEAAKKAKEAARGGLEQQHQELQLQHESLKVCLSQCMLYVWWARGLLCQGCLRTNAGRQSPTAVHFLHVT